MRRDSPATPLLIAVMFVTLCSFHLTSPPVTGLADNGDFVRLGEWLSLVPDTNASYKDLYFDYFRREWIVSDDMVPGTLLLRGTIFSGEVLIGRLALWLDELVRPDGRFDILTLGLLRVAMLSLPVFLTARALQRLDATLVWPVGISMVLMLSDRALLVYYNSLYTEPGTILGLALLIGSGLGLAVSPSTGMWAIYTLGCLALGTSRMQSVPVAMLFSLWGLCIVFRCLPSKRFIACVAVVCLAAALSLLWSHTSERFESINRYNAVFYGVLVFASEPEAALVELGGSAEMAVFAKTTFFGDFTGSGLPETHDMLSKISLQRILLWYLRHPSALFRALDSGSQRAFDYRPDDLGNLPKQSALVRRQIDQRWSLWSRAHRLIPASLWTLVCCAIATAAILPGMYRRSDAPGRRLIELFLLCALSSAIQFFGAIIGDGMNELVKHLLLFNLCFDICLIMAMGYLVTNGGRHLRRGGVPFARLWSRR